MAHRSVLSSRIQINHGHIIWRNTSMEKKLVCLRRFCPHKLLQGSYLNEFEMRIFIFMEWISARRSNYISFRYTMQSCRNDLVLILAEFYKNRKYVWKIENTWCDRGKVCSIYYFTQQCKMLNHYFKIMNHSDEKHQRMTSRVRVGKIFAAGCKDWVVLKVTEDA